MTFKVKHTNSKIKFPNPKRQKKSLKNPFRFYVYMWLRSKDSVIGKTWTPYYIGKGQCNRAYRKGCPIDKSNIIIFESGMLEEDAFELEIKLILQYGRVDLGTGILRNKTNGGDGISGYKHTKESKLKSSISNTGKKRSDKTKEQCKLSATGKIRSEESKLKQSITSTGRVNTKEHNEKSRIGNLGKKRSAETKHRNMLANIGKVLSEETKLKMRGPRGPQKKIICPHCGLCGGHSGMLRYHFDNCPQKLKSANLDVVSTSC